MRATSLVLIGVSQIHVVLNILINRNYSYCNTMYKWINKRFCLSVCLSTVLLHHIFRQVVHLSFVNPLCSCYSTKPEPTFSCCCCSVNATVSRYRLRHACVTQALRTFLFSFFKMFLSNMTPSTFPQTFAPCCVRHRISTSECSSSLTIPPTFTKPSTCLNSLSSKLMFKSSL